jgi:hypothetical protein
MGMPCEINNILKLTTLQGHPSHLQPRSEHQAAKEGYRIFPVDVPIALVDDSWMAHADVIVRMLTWSEGKTVVRFEIDRVYSTPFCVKETLCTSA